MVTAGCLAHAGISVFYSVIANQRQPNRYYIHIIHITGGGYGGRYQLLQDTGVPTHLDGPN